MIALLLGLLIPLFGTTLGAACVFLMEDQMSDRPQKTLLGFASGRHTNFSIIGFALAFVLMMDLDIVLS